MFLVNGIKLLPDESESLLHEKAAKKLSCKAENIKEIKIIKKSIDARKKPCYVYTLAADVISEKGITAEKYIPKAPVVIKNEISENDLLLLVLGLQVCSAHIFLQEQVPAL